MILSQKAAWKSPEFIGAGSAAVAAHHWLEQATARSDSVEDATAASSAPGHGI
jgi:hypothetical protein